MENNLVSFINTDNTIRGSYASKIDEHYTLYETYIYNSQEVKYEYEEEKKYMEYQLQHLINKNNILLLEIKFLNKKYYCLNVTHNNTINFIIQNIQSLKSLLNRLTYIYNKNRYYIDLIKEKIHIINSNINTCNFNIFCYKNY
jgi:hypothetical protein